MVLHPLAINGITKPESMIVHQGQIIPVGHHLEFPMELLQLPIHLQALLQHQKHTHVLLLPVVH